MELALLILGALCFTQSVGLIVLCVRMTCLRQNLPVTTITASAPEPVLLRSVWSEQDPKVKEEESECAEDHSATQEESNGKKMCCGNCKARLASNPVETKINVDGPSVLVFVCEHCDARVEVPIGQIQ